MGDGLHQQVVLFGIDVDDAGVEHLVHAAFAVPDKARGVLDEEAPLEHINGRVDVETQAASAGARYCGGR